MVIQEEIKVPVNTNHFNTPTEAFAAINHHVCEFDQPQIETILRLPIMTSSDCENDKKKDKNKKKKNKKSKSADLEAKETNAVSHISPEDLEELRSVYIKCKAVVKKIETKYGHLLNKNETEPEKSDDSGETDNCKCIIKRKILFDDEGKEFTAETDLDNHICPKKLKKRHSHLETSRAPQNNLHVEYDTPDLTLPDDLPSLHKILRDPDIEMTHRNKVIHKIKMIKQEYIDEIRFNRQSLVEKLKLNSEEIFDFKGTNLKSLPGYK